MNRSLILKKTVGEGVNNEIQWHGMGLDEMMWNDLEWYCMILYCMICYV